MIVIYDHTGRSGLGRALAAVKIPVRDGQKDFVKIMKSQNTNQKPIRCGLVGLGRIGWRFEKDALREKPASHAGAIAAHSECVLAAACDPKQAARSDFSCFFKCPLYPNATQMLARESIDILHIASSSESHPEIFYAAVEAGVPVILCEKPLANTVAEGQQMLGKKGNCRIIVNHERRYSKDYQFARQIIDTESCGPLLSIYSALYFGRKRDADQMLLHDGTHMLDILAFLTGKPLSLVSVYRETSTADSLFLNLKTSDDIPIFMETANSRDHLLFESILSFANGRLTIGNGTLRLERSKKSRHYENYRSLAPVRVPKIYPTEYFSGVMADAVRLLRDPDAKPLSGIDDGLAALRLIEKAVAPSANRGSDE